MTLRSPLHKLYTFRSVDSSHDSSRSSITASQKGQTLSSQSSTVPKPLCLASEYVRAVPRRVADDLVSMFNVSESPPIIRHHVEDVEAQILERAR